MSNYACLERYIPLVEFMGKICGKNYEIILHDVSTPERSVIAACNEHLSGRRIGDPMTELAKELMRTGVYQEHDYVATTRAAPGAVSVSSLPPISLRKRVIWWG